MITIFRKSDLKRVGNVPSNMSAKQEIELNVIPNFGGVPADYDFIESNFNKFEVVKDGSKFKAKEIVPAPTRDEINSQVVKKIREVYSVDKEFEVQRKGILNNTDSEFVSYTQHVNTCVAWGQAEKNKWGV